MYFITSLRRYLTGRISPSQLDCLPHTYRRYHNQINPTTTSADHNTKPTTMSATTIITRSGKVVMFPMCNNTPKKEWKERILAACAERGLGVPPSGPTPWRTLVARLALWEFGIDAQSAQEPHVGLYRHLVLYASYSITDIREATGLNGSDRAKVMTHFIEREMSTWAVCILVYLRREVGWH